MANARVFVDSFSAVDMPRGRSLTYADFRDAVVAAGRFSVFEATANDKAAGLFTDLERDGSVVCTRVGFPWIEVRLKQAGDR